MAVNNKRQTEQVKCSIKKIDTDMFATLTVEPDGYRHTLVECKIHFKTEKEAKVFIKEMVQRYNAFE